MAYADRQLFTPQKVASSNHRVQGSFGVVPSSPRERLIATEDVDDPRGDILFADPVVRVVRVSIDTGGDDS